MRKYLPIYLLSSIVLIAASPALSLENSGWFKINQIVVSGAANMHFRVYGMPSNAACVNGTNYAYINEADTGSKGKISTLLSAYAAGKDVRLVLEPTDHYNDGRIYCRVIEIIIKG